MGGDPALTVVPNLLATGILAMIVSLAIIVWAVWFLRGRKAGLVLLLLSIFLFLVVGHVILVFSGLLVNPEVFTTSFSLAVVLLLLSILTGIAYDIQKGERDAAPAG